MSLKFNKPTNYRLLGIILLVLTLASGCGKSNEYQDPPPPIVDVVHPIHQPVTSFVEQTGNTQATKRVDIRSRVSGFLQEPEFEDGEIVKANQLLFVIDEEPFQVKFQHAEAKKREAEANLRKAQQSKSREVSGAQLALREAEYKLAQAQHDRNAKLLTTNSISRQDFDETESALRTTQAQLVTSRSQLEQANVDFDNNILVAQAALELAAAELKTAKIDLGYCRIYSPIDGQIDRRVVDVGNYVSPEQSTVLATVVQFNPVYAYAAISEADLAAIRKHYGVSQNDQTIPIFMSIGDDRSFPYEGVVDYISPAVQTSTGTVQVRGRFNNAGEILPGMFVRIRIPTEVNPNAILVPERAIGYDQAGTFVYAVTKDMVVERRGVVVKDAVGSKRVVEGPLTIEDQIVSDGLQKVRAKMQVAFPPEGAQAPKDSSPAEQEPSSSSPEAL